MTRALAAVLLAGLAAGPAGAGAACGVFVSTTGSDDIGGGLSSDDPVRTIAYALQRASDVGAPCVFIQQGVYNETIHLQSDVQIFGGYDASWELGPYTDPEHETRLVGVFDKLTTRYRTVIAESGADVFLTNLVIEGTDAAGVAGGQNPAARSSYAVYITGGAQLTLIDARLEAGDGAELDTARDGIDAPPFAAPAGSPGQPGIGVPCSASFTIGGAPGINEADMNTQAGAGGNGGQADSGCGFPMNTQPTLGQPGDDAFILPQGGAGAGGNPGALCANSGRGKSGGFTDGDPGLGGEAGDVAGGFWISGPGQDGTTGEHGTGGGGGAGAAGCDTGNYRGASGGGGGAGGFAAFSAGEGGLGGGGSFGALVASGSLTAVNVEIVRGLGGNGGPGGDGAAGQPGGAGGPGAMNPNGTTSGDGGDGARGGNSGAGGGGTGGPSVGVYVEIGASLTNLGITVSGGAPGQGGQGGAGVDPLLDGLDGAGGMLADIFTPARHAATAVTDEQAATLAALLDRRAARGGPGCDPDPCIVDDCPADLTGDGTVNSADLGVLLAAWGPCP